MKTITPRGSVGDNDVSGGGAALSAKNDISGDGIIMSAEIDVSGAAADGKAAV